MNKNVLSELMRSGTELLAEEDPALFALLEGEYERQQDTLVMVASCSIADPSVLACQGSVAVNVTAEGYPGKRYHAGCERIDGIEQLAIDRAKAAFGAQYANTQPHSATSANYIVMSHLLSPGDTILGMGLRAGGHLTHGSKVSMSGQYFRSVHYGVDENGFIDYEQAARMAREFKPRLIICGATAYSRVVDFRRFREIADEVNAYLLADISHIAGLVITGLHPNPIDHAHFTTTCTHKQLYGPRGGLILLGRDHEAMGPDGKHTLTDLMRRAVFPYFQGAPIINAMAAKARALAVAVTPGFKATAERIVEDARALAQALQERGYRIISGGTDNHIVLVDVAARGLTGILAEQALEACGIIVNKNSIPGDKNPAEIASGVRLGTNTLAGRGYGPREMELCADLFHRVLSGIEVLGPREYSLNPTLQAGVRAEVRALSRRFPLPRYAAVHPEP
ncbi:serine hydroxymethyltransferase [Corallococcus sp. 4LFB]|uniref:serine hydroxymethyltransferase n=1 Tax=Corallococcus sp. 4LFB TaxID=3383249 RepID=UPI0039764619